MTPPDFLFRVSPLKLHVRTATQTHGEPAVYELFCRLNTTCDQQEAQQEGEPAAAAAVQWSIWKTYDEFQAFDNQMRAVRECLFAKMMVTVVFAPGHRMRAFFHQDHTPSFLEKRRAELDFYMQRVMLFPNVAEFSKKRGGCKVLADFIGAEQHIDCSGLLVPMSPNMNVSGDFSSSMGMQRDDSTNSDNRVSCASGVGTGDKVNSVRKRSRLEIEEEVALRCGDHELKRFKKHARFFRKENDPVAAATAFVEFLLKTFDPEFVGWIVQRFVRSLRSAEKREALRAAVSLSMASTGVDRMEESRSQRRNCRTSSQDDEGADHGVEKYDQKLQGLSDRHQNSDARASDPAIHGRISRKKANRQILERVNALSNGDALTVDKFKQAAKALGNQGMSGQAFADFLRLTYGKQEAEKLLLLVVEVIPQPLVQQELRVALVR
uniref:PX domain-containing protein n=1 Tax=Peronospora matthiolae TaxID=2874970 RepID=A0AAV1VL86_9STRA